MSGCTVDGCTKTGTRIIRGMCEMHYRRWRAHGDPTIVGKPGRKTTPWQVVCGDCGQHLGHVPHHGDPWQLFDRHTHRKVS